MVASGRGCFQQGCCELCGSVFFSSSFSTFIYKPACISPVRGLLGQKLSLSLGLEGPSMLFSMDFSQQRHKRVPFFSRSSLAFIVCSCFDDGHFVGIPVCRFDSVF